MFIFHERSLGNVVGIKASGKLTNSDYEQIGSRLEELIKEYRKVRILFELEDYSGCTLRGAWDEMKFWFNHSKDVERCAVVGENRWQKWITQVSRPFYKGKYFDRAEIGRAWEWVLEGSEAEVLKG